MKTGATVDSTPAKLDQVARGPVRIALLGCGTVGSALVRALTQDPELASRFTIVAIAVRDPRRDRPCALPVEPRTDAVEIATRARADVVVEVMGGIDVAREAVVAGLERGLPVVTANKQLLSEHGPALRRLACAHGAQLRHEAAVAAGVPLLHTLDYLSRADTVDRLEAVLNGTCNFVLDAMVKDELPLHDAISRAQSLGFAEADVGRDTSGRDTADKLAIIAQLLWGTDVRGAEIQRRGIEALSLRHLKVAARRSEVWRLVASGTPAGRLCVEPRRLPSGHVLAALQGAENGIILEARRSGKLVLQGPGAGGDATASAVLADLIDVAWREPHTGAPSMLRDKVDSSCGCT